jgi:hypothetical protein
MRSAAGWWLMWHVWRLLLLVGGAALLVWGFENVTNGVTTWPVFTVGAAAGTGIAAVAMFWPRRGPDGKAQWPVVPIETHVVVGAVAIAMMVVIGLLGRYGAAVGAFSVITGLAVLERFRRDWRRERARARTPRL